MLVRSRSFEEFWFKVFLDTVWISWRTTLMNGSLLFVHSIFLFPSIKYTSFELPMLPWSVPTFQSLNPILSDGKPSAVLSSDIHGLTPHNLILRSWHHNSPKFSSPRCTSSKRISSTLIYIVHNGRIWCYSTILCRRACCSGHWRWYWHWIVYAAFENLNVDMQILPLLWRRMGLPFTLLDGGRRNSNKPSICINL